MKGIITRGFDITKDSSDQFFHNFETAIIGGTIGWWIGAFLSPELSTPESTRNTMVISGAVIGELIMVISHRVSLGIERGNEL